MWLQLEFNNPIRMHIQTTVQLLHQTSWEVCGSLQVGMSYCGLWQQLLLSWRGRLNFTFTMHCHNYAYITLKLLKHVSNNHRKPTGKKKTTCLYIYVTVYRSFHHLRIMDTLFPASLAILCKLPCEHTSTSLQHCDAYASVALQCEFCSGGC